MVTKKNIAILCLLDDYKKDVAKTLANKLQMFYAAVDEIIEYENTNLKELLKIKGENFYEKLEEKAINELSSFENAVITTNFLSIVSKTNLNKLKENCFVVFIDVDKQTYFEELRKTNLNSASKLQVSELVFEERNKLLSKASDIFVKTTKLNVANVVKNVIIKMKEFYNIK